MSIAANARRVLACWSAVAAAAAVGSAAATAPPSGTEPDRIDRIVAVVNEDPILASDVERVIALGLVEPGEQESDEEMRARVVERLIEERLRFQEIDRFGFSDVPLEEVEAGYEQIRARFPGPAAFAARLEELGLEERELRNMVARQVMVLTFVEERLGPRVFVDLEDIRTYYDTVLVPRLRDEGADLPPLDAVRETIRRVLKEARLNEELRQWTEELRREADVEEYPQPSSEGPLPPPGS